MASRVRSFFILDKTGTIKAKLYEEPTKSGQPAALVVTTLDKIAAGTN